MIPGSYRENDRRLLVYRYNLSILLLIIKMRWRWKYQIISYFLTSVQKLLINNIFLISGLQFNVLSWFGNSNANYSQIGNKIRTK